MKEHSLSEGFLETALNWYQPLAQQIYSHQNGGSAVSFVGVNGCQGSGKSTLTEFLKVYLEQEYQLNVAVLSLDDFYLDQSARQQLAQTVHPLLKTRGVPGTHNCDLMAKTFTDLKNQTLGISLPRFNKAIDNPYPESQWPVVTDKVDLVIMEGWCWGVENQSEEALISPINKLEQQQDPEGFWRKTVNDKLKSDYESLYIQMDFWVMLKAPSFDTVFNWRKEQEAKLALTVADKENSGVMTDAELENFIQHYQRLTEHSLNTQAKNMDVVFELDNQRHIIKACGLSC